MLPQRIEMAAGRVWRDPPNPATAGKRACTKFVAEACESVSGTATDLCVRVRRVYRDMRVHVRNVCVKGEVCVADNL